MLHRRPSAEKARLAPTLLGGIVISYLYTISRWWSRDLSIMKLYDYFFITEIRLVKFRRFVSHVKPFVIASFNCSFIAICTVDKDSEWDDRVEKNVINAEISNSFDICSFVLIFNCLLSSFMSCSQNFYVIFIAIEWFGIF